MIDWKQVIDLHAIHKVETIVQKWFNVEIFFVNEHNQIYGNILKKDHQFYNNFLKIQLESNFGTEYLKNDIEETMKELKKPMYYNSTIQGIRGIAAPIFLDGVLSGAVFCAPYIPDSFSSEEKKKTVEQLIKLGVQEKDTSIALDGLTLLNLEKKNRLIELMELIAEEVVTFHEEINTREEKILKLNEELSSKHCYSNIIGKSKKMQMVYHLLEKIKNSESTVLIQGDNGTGKELIAKAIHYQSHRKDRVFIAQNCSAFNDNLLDSELFGHVRGSFTGAIKDKKGLFEIANGGTLFLDEVGDTSSTMQVKILRVLQEGTFLPVGATQPKKVNVRIIAATNRPLIEMIEKGEFREDLYYRINVINVSLPPLKSRPEDIPLLSEHFMEKHCSEMGTPSKAISKMTLEKMLNHSWPGNVRELQNEIERMIVLAGSKEIITPDLLSPQITNTIEGKGQIVVPRGVNMRSGLKLATKELEIMMIREGLERCNFNKSKLSKELGISRGSLIMKIEKYGLSGKKDMAS